ncbi:MAG TPA: alkaline phosphatase family protein [Thermoanaerobaculia bacterium]|nr:alkaline phosphatase family protein [Thermoanaerobaculia bacterium]
MPALGADGYIEKITRGIGGECYHNPTLADRMAEKAKPVSWTHYTSRMWDATNRRFVFSTVFNGFINSKAWYQKTPSWPSSLYNLENDVNRHGVLREVTWVKPPCIPLSDHPSGASTDDSMNWVPTVINWIGRKKALWQHSVIFVVRDDWGGFYDHVVPPITPGHKLTPGARIAFLLISPYGRNGDVINAPADYASILKFIEDLYDLNPLTDNDKLAHDLGPFFDFTRPRNRSSPFLSRVRTSRTCAGSTRRQKRRSIGEGGRGGVHTSRFDRFARLSGSERVWDFNAASEALLPGTERAPALSEAEESRPPVSPDLGQKLRRARRPRSHGDRSDPRHRPR